MLVSLSGVSVSAPARNYRAHADAAQEVADPPVESRAQGQATFQLRDGELHYRVNAAQLRDVTMSHLHLAPAGSNGPPVVWLGDHRAAPLERVNGRYVTGTISAEDLVGPLAGEPLSRLIEEIEAGNVYVNIHTDEYPGGEIRGQLF